MTLAATFKMTVPAVTDQYKATFLVGQQTDKRSRQCPSEMLPENFVEASLPSERGGPHGEKVSNVFVGKRCQPDAVRAGSCATSASAARSREGRDLLALSLHHHPTQARGGAPGCLGTSPQRTRIPTQNTSPSYA